MTNSGYRVGVAALALSATAVLLPVSQADAASEELIAAAKEEGRVVWYTTMIIDQAVRPMAEAFEAKYPEIDVEFSRAGSGDTALKIINEGQAGRMQGDVFDGTSTFASVMPAGMVEPYTPDAVADYPEESKDPDGHWHALNYYYLTAAYNTDLVSEEDAPNTYEDLLAPEWTDRMVWSVEPEPVAAPGFAGNVLMTMGDEEGRAYLEQLADQNITNMAASQRTVLDRVILGDFPIGLMVFNHHVVISQTQGAPIEWIRMEPLVNSASLLGLIKDGPNPNAGKLLIDYILSEEGQKVLAGTGYLPTHPNVQALEPTLQPTGPEPFEYRFMSPETVSDNLTDWIKIIDELFM